MEFSSVSRLSLSSKCKLNVNMVCTALIALLLASCAETPDRFATSSDDFCSTVSDQTNTTLSQQFEKVADKMENKTGVYVLEQGVEAMLSRAWLSQHAENSIDVQYFIFSSDNVGLIATDYLVKAAERGVKVRILIDDIMVDANGYELLALAEHDNISIKIYNPVANVGKNILEQIYNLTTRFEDVNKRMHNKTFTVDGKITITGGRNVADEYFGYDHEFNFRDRDVVLIGGVVSDVQTSFNQFWQSELSVSVTKLVDPSEMPQRVDYEPLHQYACNPENFLPQVRARIKDVPAAFFDLADSGQVYWVDDVEYVSDEPGKNTKQTFLSGGGVSTERLIELLSHAKKSVSIQTPYLVTTDLGKDVFAQLVKNGVEVSILTNSLASNDNLEAFSGYQRDRKSLLATGVQIYEFKPDAQIRKKIMAQDSQADMTRQPIFGLHSKTMVIDDDITVIGSFNLDPRSANLNTESITIIRSPAIAKSVKAGMDEEIQPENAWHVTSEWNPDSTVDLTKRMKVKMRRVVPKSIL